MTVKEAKEILEDMLYEHQKSFNSRLHFSDDEVEAIETILEYLEW